MKRELQSRAFNELLIDSLGVAFHDSHRMAYVEARKRFEFRSFAAAELSLSLATNTFGLLFKVRP